MECSLVQSDKRETTAMLEDIRFISDWNIPGTRYTIPGTLTEGKVNNHS